MNMIINVCIIVALTAMLAGCSMDSAQLGEYVRKEMQEELVKKDGLKALQMKEVRLVKGEGISYSGVGKGEIDGCPVKFDVTCKYDGKTVIWDASLSDDNQLSLVAKEKAKEIYEKVKSLVPIAKEGIRQKYDAASKKAEEYCDVASKKAAECLDNVKAKLQSDAQTGEQKANPVSVQQ